MPPDEIFIMQCEKAEEIQGLWKPKIGDWFYKRDGIGYGLWCISDVKETYIMGCGEGMHRPPYEGVPVIFMVKENYIWLPRQDQLQEMARTKDAYLLLKHFSDWAMSGDRCENRDYLLLSMEQLWLAFVMKEKYGKIWDGETWEEK